MITWTFSSSDRRFGTHLAKQIMLLAKVMSATGWGKAEDLVVSQEQSLVHRDLVHGNNASKLHCQPGQCMAQWSRDRTACFLSMLRVIQLDTGSGIGTASQLQSTRALATAPCTIHQLRGTAQSEHKIVPCDTVGFAALFVVKHNAVICWLAFTPWQTDRTQTDMHNKVAWVEGTPNSHILLLCHYWLPMLPTNTN